MRHRTFAKLVKRRAAAAALELRPCAMPPTASRNTMSIKRGYWLG